MISPKVTTLGAAALNTEALSSFSLQRLPGGRYAGRVGPGKPMGVARRWTKVKPEGRRGVVAQDPGTLVSTRYHAREPVGRSPRAPRRLGPSCASGDPVIIDSSVTLEDLRKPLSAFWPVSGAKIAGLCESWDPAKRLARVHRPRPLHQPGLDRVDAGLPVRLGDPAVRRHGRRALPRARPARHARSTWRRTSRTSASTTTDSTTSAPTATSGG